MEETLKKIKETILNVSKLQNVKINKVILFGSRARGDYREDSDWDILIVTEDKLDKKTWEDFSYNVSLALIDLLDSPVDVLIIDKEDYEDKKKYKGFVYYWATVEGKEI